MSFDELAERLLCYDSRELGVGAEAVEIDNVERSLNVKIVGSYREFLLRFGWGGVEHIEIFGLGSNVPEHLHLDRVTKSERTMMNPPLRVGLLPVMNDGGGNLSCLDCNNAKNGECAIVFWDHDMGAQQHPQQEASNFTEWLWNKLDEL